MREPPLGAVTEELQPGEDGVPRTFVHLSRKLAGTQAPVRIWLSSHGEVGFVAAFSDARVARALEDHGVR